MRKSVLGFALSPLPFALSFLGAMLFALCSSAQPQQPKKVFRIGYLSDSTPARESARSEAVGLALRELGYTEGKNIITEYRYAGGKLDRAPELAAELARLQVDVIVVAGGDTQSRAAKNATKSIPIVMMGYGADPVGAGLVEILARPGGNVTGITLLNRELGENDWSCSKKPLRNLRVSRFSTTRPIETMSAS